MRTATLFRGLFSDEGTFGFLSSEDFSCYMTELPWKENKKQVSCIPTGSYECKWHKSPKFGPCYILTDVPNRSKILIHAGNFAGDVSLGFKSNSYGCLLPATKLGSLKGQKAGLLSALAVRNLNRYFNKETFLLEIKDDLSSDSPSLV